MRHNIPKQRRYIEHSKVLKMQTCTFTSRAFTHVAHSGAGDLENRLQTRNTNTGMTLTHRIHTKRQPIRESRSYYGCSPYLVRAFLSVLSALGSILHVGPCDNTADAVSGSVHSAARQHARVAIHAHICVSVCL
jgi:hypothetical protein